MNTNVIRAPLLAHRPEIDGLRAIAVLPVILFHAGLTSFSGGYVGVDVFFVISGFLITGIILRELDQDTFSIGKFYLRRARRILPLLLLVMTCCLPFAYMWMLPEQYKDFSQSIVTIIFFSSNLLFWQESGYFAATEDLKPLLHTWSLAVEEQFYLIFPFFVFLMQRWLPKRLGLAVVLGCLGSLLLSHWGSQHFASANFYLAPTRAWELLLGSLCAIYGSRFIQWGQGSSFLNARNLLSGLGLCMILSSVLLYDEKTPFPSIYALLPTVGTALVILFATQATIVHRILSMRILVGIGLISYSLYLWHQPAFAFARIRSIGEPSTAFLLGLALALVPLSYLSWRFVELPFRQPKLLPNRPAFVTLGLATTLLLALGALGHFTNGIPNRLSPAAQKALVASNDKSPYNACLDGIMRGLGSDRACTLGNATKSTVDFVVVGDSFAAAIAPGISKSAEKFGERGGFLAISSCPALLKTGGSWIETREKCSLMQGSMVSAVQSSGAKTVFLASAWNVRDHALECKFSGIACKSARDVEAGLQANFAATVNAFQKIGVNVIVVGVPPNPKTHVPIWLAKSIIYEKKSDLSVDQKESYDPYVDGMFQRGKEFGFSYVDISDAFCAGGTCSITKGGASLFHDAGHLTSVTAQGLSDRFNVYMQTN